MCSQNQCLALQNVDVTSPDKRSGKVVKHYLHTHPDLSRGNRFSCICYLLFLLLISLSTKILFNLKKIDALVHFDKDTNQFMQFCGTFLLLLVRADRSKLEGKAYRKFTSCNCLFHEIHEYRFACHDIAGGKDFKE